jgi:hypothetical protein
MIITNLFPVEWPRKAPFIRKQHPGVPISLESGSGRGALSRSQWEAATSMPWWRVRISGVRRSRFYPAERAAVASVTNVT